MSDAIRSERPMTTRQPRPTYTVHLRPLPGVDAVRALRGALKVMLRRFGLQAVGIEVSQSSKEEEHL